MKNRIPTVTTCLIGAGLLAVAGMSGMGAVNPSSGSAPEGWCGGIPNREAGSASVI